MDCFSIGAVFFMKSKTEISVILPYFNAEKTLERAIDSILNQTFKNFELLLINNNSTDRSYSITEKYSSKDSRVKLLNEEKQGVAFASEKGFKHSSGKYTARTDADDFCYPEKLQKQYNFLENNKDADVIGTRVNFKGPKENKGIQLYINETNKLITHNKISLNRFIELQVINPTIMFRKEIAEKFGFYKNGDFPEDYELFLRWIDKGVKYAKLPEFLLDWHDSANRLTRTDKSYSEEAFYLTKTPYLVKYLKDINSFFPHVAIWGAGKKSRKRSDLLKNYGVEIDFYIDVDKKKINKNTIHYKNIPIPGKHFILSYVTNRGAREEIRKFLIEKKYKEGENFMVIG